MFSAIQNPGHWLLGTVAITALTVGSADAVPNPFASKLPGTIGTCDRSLLFIYLLRLPN